MKKIFCLSFGVILLLSSSLLHAQDVSNENTAVMSASSEILSPNPTNEDNNTLNINIDDVVPTELIIMRLVEDEVKNFYKEDIFEEPDFPSLLFLPDDHALLTAAISRFVKRAPDEDGVLESDNPQLPPELDDGSVEVEVEPEIINYPRNVSLGGILYFSNSNWIIWLNEKRVTPKAMPEEIVKINVNKQTVELRWLDKKTNTVFPIRLRPNQRFNLDARMFLPG